MITVTHEELNRVAEIVGHGHGDYGSRYEVKAIETGTRYTYLTWVTADADARPRGLRQAEAEMNAACRRHVKRVKALLESGTAEVPAAPSP